MFAKNTFPKITHHIDRSPIHLSFWQILLLLSFVIPINVSAQNGPQPRLPAIELTTHIHVIRAEIARTTQEQTLGLMYRQSMDNHEGMLFIYDQLGIRCFWMRNTLIPLTIAFIADDGTIVNTKDMQPETENTHCSSRPVRFALEMNQGWFMERGIKVGSKIQGLPSYP
ncbi:hypothetical protein W03_03810 [Nitrosomonas sp. PY1]|uniref:DUF192 domain-containing protein n=1 Tax=Nitrosomonas sp. PY1 TaxID=1803906 RepID=UPI001FC8B651|nr:DUF192 domain-containing protein [Nitrosomonas sp. PY1]GKS68377.1 hypothetical protein W03_03810 [Nitrosomonas sp. PY1]